MNMATRLFSAAESQLELDLDGDEPVPSEERLLVGGLR